MPKSKRAIFALTQAYVEMLHDDLVSVLWPATDPIALHEYRDIHLLSSATARPFQSAFGQDVYSGIFEKGATPSTTVTKEPQFSHWITFC